MVYRLANVIYGLSILGAVGFAIYLGVVFYQIREDLDPLKAIFLVVPMFAGLAIGVAIVGWVLRYILAGDTRISPFPEKLKQS